MLNHDKKDIKMENLKSMINFLMCTRKQQKQPNDKKHSFIALTNQVVWMCRSRCATLLSQQEAACSVHWAKHEMVIVGLTPTAMGRIAPSTTYSPSRTRSESPAVTQKRKDNKASVRRNYSSVSTTTGDTTTNISTTAKTISNCHCYYTATASATTSFSFLIWA